MGRATPYQHYIADGHDAEISMLTVLSGKEREMLTTDGLTIPHRAELVIRPDRAASAGYFLPRHSVFGNRIAEGRLTFAREAKVE